MAKSILSILDFAFGKPAPAGDACPECGSRLMRREGELDKPETGSEDWHCPNPDCPAQVRRWLVFWCSPEAMDIPGGDEKLVALLTQQGLALDVAELYRIKAKELAALPGIANDSAQAFFDAITVSMKREGWRLLFGLNIPFVGAAEAEALLRGFSTVDAVFAAGVPRLMKDAGMSEPVARSIVRWHTDSINRKLVKRLQKAGLNFKSEAP